MEAAAENESGENVAADDGIPMAARDQPGPGHENARPQAAEIRLESDIHEPDQDRVQQRVADRDLVEHVGQSGDEPVLRDILHHEVREPVAGEHEQGDDRGASPISSPGTQVTNRKEHPADGRHEDPEEEIDPLEEAQPLRFDTEGEGIETRAPRGRGRNVHDPASEPSGQQGHRCIIRSGPGTLQAVTESVWKAGWAVGTTRVIRLAS
jgi:hypothetical protein